jgi:hypothetical protein
MNKGGTVFQACFVTFWATVVASILFPIKEDINNLVIVGAIGLLVAGGLTWLASKNKF